MRDIEDFFRFVQPYAPACPEPVASKYVREAAIEFCERTRCWRLSDRFVVSGHEIETACVPPDAELFEIEEAWFDGRPLERAPFVEAIDEPERFGQPRFITQAGPGTVQLAPRGPGVLKLSIFLKPSFDAESLPDFLYDQFGRVLGWGALREVMMLPNQPFSSADMATYYGQRFEAACDRHFALNIRGQQRAPARTKPSFF